MSDYRTKIQKQQIQLLKQNTELFNEIINNSKYKRINNYIEMVEKNCIQYSDGMQLFIIRILKNIFCCNNLYKIPVSFLLTAKQLTPYNEAMGIKRNIKYTQKKLRILVNEGFLGRIKVEGLKGYFYYLKHDITKPFDRTGKNDFEEKNTDTTPAEDDMLQMEKEDYNDKEEKTNTLTITNTQQEYLTFFNTKTNEQEEKQNTETALLQCLDELGKIDISDYSKEEFKKMFIEFCKPRKNSKGKHIKQKSPRAMIRIVNNLKRLSDEFNLNAFECLNRGLSDDWQGIEIEYFKNEIEKQKKESKIIPSTPLKNMIDACRNFLYYHKYDVKCLLNILDLYKNNGTNVGYKCCQMFLKYQADKHFDKLIKTQSEIDKKKQEFFENINSTLFEAHNAGIKYIPLLFVYQFFMLKSLEWEKEYDIFFFEDFKNKNKIDDFKRKQIIANKEEIKKQISEEERKIMREYFS